jgi:hypothetical protein
VGEGSKRREREGYVAASDTENSVSREIDMSVEITGRRRDARITPPYRRLPRDPDKEKKIKRKGE